MKTASWVLIGLLALISFGCASTPGPDGPGPVRVAGEWRGDAAVGPQLGCCKGSPGAVRLLLEQNGGAVKGSLEGTGWRGIIKASVKGAELWGSCDCMTTQAASNLSFEASVSGEDMVIRVGDAGMTLTRTP